MNIAFILDEFLLKTPGQQLLDRFLLGYFRDGEFKEPGDRKVVAWIDPAKATAELKARAANSGLRIAGSPASALENADAAIVVPGGAGGSPNEGRVAQTLEMLRPETRCFVVGRLAVDREEAEKLVKAAAARKIRLCAGSAISVTFRLPEMTVPAQARIKRALIVVHGDKGSAEWEGVDGLLPILERRRNGETGVEGVRVLQGRGLWAELGAGQPFQPLLAAAVSRSSNIQGDPVKDGRTQDVAGLGLMENLAKDPRGWILEHRDGVRSAVVVLNGVLADINFAVELASGEILSSQLYRPPAPMQEHFSLLAAVIDDFIRTGKMPWPVDRCVLAAQLMHAMEG